MLFIKPSEGRVTSHYSPMRKNPKTGVMKAHKGIDYGKDGSSDIVAAADGTVKRTATDGRINYTGGSFGGYGNVVIITHNINGVKYETLYAHLKSVSVKPGQKVKQGQKIGVRGHTGNSTGEHLHFEIHKPEYKAGQPNAINPFPLVVDPDVLYLQKKLIELGYKLEKDGIMGDSTFDAVVKFQKGSNLKADGIAGEITLSKINEAIRAMYNPPKKEEKKVAGTSTEKKKDDYVGHWAEESIKKADKKGIMTIDKDNNFNPNGALTRGQAAAILDRLGLLD